MKTEDSKMERENIFKSTFTSLSIFIIFVTHRVQSLSVHDDQHSILTDFDGLTPDPQSFGAGHCGGSNCKPSHSL